MLLMLDKTMFAIYKKAAMEKILANGLRLRTTATPDGSTAITPDGSTATSDGLAQ